MLYSQVPCRVAGTFTTNVVKAAPVKWDSEIVHGAGMARGGGDEQRIANACTGKEGMDCCEETAKAAGERLGIPREQVLVASTGVIGQQLPMELIKKGIDTMVPMLSRKPWRGNAGGRGYYDYGYSEKGGGRPG